MELKIKVNVDPMPAPRPRSGSRGVYMPKAYQNYKEVIGYAGRAAMSGRSPASETLAVELKFRRKYKVASRRFGDLDNLVKGVMDALNGICFEDDALVTKVTAMKEQTDSPGIEILIHSIGTFG